MGDLTATEQALVERAVAAPMLEQVQQWAAINSGSGNLAGLQQITQTLADAYAALPGDLRVVMPQPNSAIDAGGSEQPVEHGQHLHLIVRPEATLQLLFTGHMDTVYPADHPFQQLAWRDEGVLNGPGVADMKGGIAVMLAALAALESSPLRSTIGYEVVINSDEEVGSPSSSSLLALAARNKRAALTYEPSTLPDGTLAGTRPGSGNFSFVIQGRSAHAGRNPQDGRNAVVAAADLALRLTALIEPGLTVNVARVDGGGPNNVVPDRAVLRVNLRPATPELEAKADAAIEDTRAAVASEHDVSIHRHGGFGRPPKPMTPALEQLFGLVRRAGNDLGQAISWQPSGGVCDGNNIAACGVPVVDTMGVRGGAIHSADEYLIVSSLAERAALSALTIARLAGEAA